MSIPHISIKHIRSFQSAKIDVAPPIAIHIAQRHAGPVLQDAILRGKQIGEVVGESDSGLFWRQKGEAAFPGGWHGEFAPATAGADVPVQLGRPESLQGQMQCDASDPQQPLALPAAERALRFSSVVRAWSHVPQRDDGTVMNSSKKKRETGNNP